MNVYLKAVILASLLSVPVATENSIYQLEIIEDPMKSEYDSLIKAAVKKYLPRNYDWRLFKAQLWAESQLDPLARSGKGALGIAQFMPKTWTEEAPKAGFKGAKRTDPEASIFTAASYMASLIKKWHWPRPTADRECLAMASYNVGFGNMLKAQKRSGNLNLYADIISSLPDVPRVNHNETITYVRRIMDYCSGQVTGEITND